MTRAEYHNQLKRLHPDLNGGDHSRVKELQKVIKRFRITNSICGCGCGKLLEACHAKRPISPKAKSKLRFINTQHLSRYMATKRQKSKQLK